MSTTLTPRACKNTHKITSEEMEKMRKKDHRIVKGIFRCAEPRGGSIKFSFKKYKGDDVLNYTMTDGEIRDVPFMIATHLSNDCCYEKHTHVLDGDGNATLHTGKKVHRCSFESLEFQDLKEE